MNKRDPLDYRSYLLRRWREVDQTNEVPVWRFSLQDPHTGKR